MNWLPQSLQTLESALALSLVQALWQDTLLAVTAAATLAVMARRSASARHAVGLLFLVAMLVWPLAQFARLALGGVPVKMIINHGAALALPDPVAAMEPSPLTDLTSTLLSGASPTLLALTWATGVLFMMVRLAGGAWLLQTLHRRAMSRPSARIQAIVDAQRAVLGIDRPVAVRVLNTIDLPFTSQAWRPMLWLPLSMLTRLTPDHLEALVAHELAHVRRLDWIWNGLQCLIEALLFFHPAMWWLSRRVRCEREHACDDIAAEVCGNRILVAEALACLESLRAPRQPQLALAANGGKLVQRIERLVTVEDLSGFRWRRLTASAILIGCSGILAVGAGVAAESPAPATGTAAAAGANASTDPAWSRFGWWTRVGNSIELRDDDHGHLRDYHAWVDLKGGRHETYQVDGKDAAIDDTVRQWVAQQSKAPIPPEPPAPPPPPEAQLPPAPPPPPPALEDEPAYRSIVEQLQHDPRAIALLGSPIRIDQDCSPCHLDEHSVSLHLSASGPKGSTHVAVEGRLVDGRWQLTTLKL